METPASPSSHAARILMVCMGNICRSPTAEEVFRVIARREAPHLHLVVDSAGTHDYDLGQPPDPRTQAAARRRGYDLSALRARQLVAADYHAFDLILFAEERNQRDAARHAPPRPRARLARLLDFAPGQPLRDLPDPYYGGPADFERVLDLCELAARGLVRQLQEGAAP